jgi:hypothetical protein
LAFIDLPSWSRGSRPYFLGQAFLGQARGNPQRIPSSRLPSNLGAALVAAKGTTWDYFAYLSAIPAQIMALAGVFSGVVKTAKAD